MKIDSLKGKVLIDKLKGRVLIRVGQNKDRQIARQSPDRKATCWFGKKKNADCGPRMMAGLAPDVVFKDKHARFHVIIWECVFSRTVETRFPDDYPAGHLGGNPVCTSPGEKILGTNIPFLWDLVRQLVARKVALGALFFQEIAILEITILEFTFQFRGV